MPTFPKFFLFYAILLLALVGFFVMVYRQARLAGPDPAERARQAFANAADFTLAAPWFFLATFVLASILCRPGPIQWGGLMTVSSVAGLLAALRLLSLTGKSTFVLGLVQMAVVIGIQVLIFSGSSDALELRLQRWFAAGLVFLGVQTLAWPWVRGVRASLGDGSVASPA